MSRGRTLDDPIELARLVPAGELRELATSIERALGCRLAIMDKSGVVLAGAADPGATERPFEHEGERLGAIGASGPQAAAAIALATDMLGLLVHHAHARELAAATHEEAMQVTFAELTEHNQRLTRAVSRLEELDRLKSNFLATVSHELRTPLTSIIGYSDMLAAGIAGELTGEQGEFVETIRGKGDHLLALITSLLDLNKLEQGNLPLQREPVHPRALIEDLAKTVLPQAAKKGVKLEVELGEGLEPIPLDSVRLKQVLFNLGENAIKFTPPSGVVRFGARVTEMSDGGEDGDGGLGLVLMAAPRRALELSVQDSGVGIPRAEHRKIFDAFYQVDGSSTREHGGTGLGLSIVKRLVEAHGGTVTVESEPGQGAKFRVTIPEPDELL